MLRFKLKQENHERLSVVCLGLCVVGYACLAVAMSYTSIAGYVEARSILTDHTVIQAPFELENTTESYSRRAGTRTRYHFRYFFEVDGTRYEDTFSVSESNIEKFVGMDSVEIAFSNASHEFERMERLRGNDSLPGAI